jgi:ADP-ribose pyrophosphatase
MPEKTKPWQYVISGKHRLLDAFFKVDEYTVSHEQFDGKMSPERSVLVFERGDAVAALLYDPERRVIITVNQFRLPVHAKSPGRGWLVEAVAGMIPFDEEGKPKETPLETLIREVGEETGYQLTRATEVSKFFSSPGGSSELIYLYYAEVRKVDKKGEGGGVAADGEDIEIVEYPIDDFFKRLRAGEFEDPKLIIAGQWLLARRGSIRAEFSDDISRKFVARLNDRQILGIKTGNIAATKDVEVWVNSENTDMMMDRFFGRSVSATIRSLGARKNEDGRSIADDTIGKALTAELGPRSFVRVGTVIQTGAGELERTHNVRRLFHVASVAGSIGSGLSTTLQNIELAMDNVLRAISAAKRYRSALVPIFGTGQGGFLAGDVIPLLVKRVLVFFRENPKSTLREVYFLAYSEGDLETLKNAISISSAVEPVEVGDEAPGA